VGSSGCLGVGLLILFIFLILYSLNVKPSRFIKYLLSYLVFFATFAFLFIHFREVSLYIGLLAGIGWMVLIVIGSKGDNKPLSGFDDAIKNRMRRSGKDRRQP